MTSVLGKLHDMVFTEPEKAETSVYAMPTPVTRPETVQSSTDYLGDDAVYQSLFHLTDPASSPKLQKFYETAKKLESVISDRTTRMKAAMATSEITPDTLRSSVKELKQALDTEVSRGTAKLAESASAARNAQANLEKQLAAAREQTAKIESASTKFGAASHRRASELDQLETELLR